ncbi:MAG: NTP transferase domain-containing protein [Clostridia bacterium]|nr:NTP transferase domain-containing protein [Clostridia bacterium]
MNNKVTVEDFDIFKTIKYSNSKTQRELAEKSGYSLGRINKSIAVLRESGYIDNENNITDSAIKFINASKPKSAVILAAGFGMRMVPLNSELPKGLIEVHGEPLIERTIRHLNEAGISDIYIVVGFMKEMYDYSIVL